MTFKVGDKVRLSLEGRREYFDNLFNPHDAVGKVIEDNRYSFAGYCFRVDWGENNTNVYRHMDLQHEIEEKVVEAPVKDSTTSYPFSYDEKNISVFVSGKLYVLPSTSMQFDTLKEHLKGSSHDYDTIMSIVDQRKTVETASDGRIKVVGDTVYYNGEVTHSSVTDKLVAMKNEGFDIQPWVLFMELLMKNPNKHSVEALYNFLDHFKTPITGDGHFLAFKRVSGDYMDLHSRTMDNSPGKIVTMPREEVDTNSSISCSRGLHACADNYLGDFYANSSNARVVVVKISPEDVCAVPDDYNFSKMRVCRYEVIGDAEEKDITRLSETTFTDEFDQPPEPMDEYRSTVSWDDDVYLDSCDGYYDSYYDSYED